MANLDGKGPRFQLKKSNSSTSLLRRHGSSSNVQRQRRGILLNPLRDSPPLSPGVIPQTPASSASARRRRGSFISIITMGMKKWEMLRRVFKLCIVLKQGMGKGRHPMTVGRHEACLFHAATCSHCFRDYISDTNWFRCNQCTAEKVDLCRACFKAWAHHEHTFTEMSVTAFKELCERKKRWFKIVKEARVSGELEGVVNTFEDEVVKQLTVILTEMSRGRVLQEEVESVMLWAMSSRVGLKLEATGREYGWDKDGGFEKHLDAARAKHLKLDIQRIFRKKVSLPPSNFKTQLSFETADKLQVTFITNDDGVLCEVPLEGKAFQISSIRTTNNPTTLVIEPEHFLLKIPKHLLYSTLQALRGVAIQQHIDNNLPEEILEVIDSSDEEMLPKTRTGSMYIPGDPLGHSRQVSEDYNEYNVRKGSDLQVKKLVVNWERTKHKKEVEKEVAWKQSQTAAATRATIKENSLRHLKKKRSQQNLMKSLWDSAASEDGLPKELEMLRNMMSGLIDGVKSLIAVIQNKDAENGRKFTALDDVMKKVPCTEHYICKEISTAINEVMAELRVSNSTGKMTEKGTQWVGAHGWEAVHPSSRLRSGRVGFEKEDAVCYATTRHETVALGKEEIPDNAATSVTLKYRIVKCGEGTYLGVGPPGMACFDKDTTGRSGVFWKPDGTLYNAGSIVPIGTTAKYATGDIIKLRVKNNTNGYVKLYLNSDLVHSMPFPCPHTLIPYVMFYGSQNCRVEVFPITRKDPRLSEDPLSVTPAPVLRILRSLEGDMMSAQDRSLKRPPPKGLVTLVFTDVQSSTTLWDNSAEGMKVALAQHNKILRRLIEKYRGYEVKTEGDAFMVAFQRTESALHWCIESQRELMNTKWPEDLLRHEEAGVQTDNEGNVVLRGLRVRMGFHTGEPDCEQDPVTGRMDYFGPMVNLAARIAGIGYGGEIVIGGAAFRHLHRCGALPDDNIFLSCHGSKSLKGIARNESLFSLLPIEFKTRPDCWVSSPRKISLASPTAPSSPTFATSTPKETQEGPAVQPQKVDQVPSTVSSVLKEKEPRWVRTVWRQAAARAVKQACKEVHTQVNLAPRGNGSNYLNHLQHHEKVLMALHDDRQVYITSSVHSLNGEVAYVAGWKGAEEVLVDYKGGQMTLPVKNLSKYYDSTDIVKEEKGLQVEVQKSDASVQHDALLLETGEECKRRNSLYVETEQDDRRRLSPLHATELELRRSSISSLMSASPSGSDDCGSPVLRGRVRIASTPSPIPSQKAPLQPTLSTFTFPGPLSAPLFTPARTPVPIHHRRPLSIDKRRVNSAARK
eukprot:TRINITY_DN9797_c0_g1_i1.p1 TRINITY_DN9797_c0_g1~~TRINITY_DN9797_c0_g1_i1.p1  ORF type:complete len:1304 (+),score=235.24 TRINITY_DN9797_c0_g1_i1:35-3946(+)